MDLGATAFLVKPVSASTVEQLVRNLIAKARSEAC